MGKVYQKSWIDGESQYSTAPSPEGKTEEGQESVVSPAEIHFEHFSGTTTLKGFVEKKGRGKTVPEINLFALVAINNFKNLKSLNARQKPGEHKFNLPNTCRLIANTDKTKSLLITDVRRGGKCKLTDLKNAKLTDFSPETLKLIKEEILADLSLAEQNLIALNHPKNIIHPLDTWTLITDTETNKQEVMILDFGERLAFNRSEEELNQIRNNIIKALKQGNIKT